MFFYYNKDRVQGEGQALYVFACEIVPISSAFIEQGQEELKVAYRWNDLNWLMHHHVERLSHSHSIKGKDAETNQPKVL